MKPLFEIIYDTLAPGGDLKFKVVDTKVVDAMRAYIDYRRDSGTAVGGPEFPRDWHCISAYLSEREFSDMVPGMGAATIMRTPVFEHCRHLLDAAYDIHEIEVDGERLTWFSLPTVNISPSIEVDHPSMFILKKRYRDVCTDAFKVFWESKDFTGIGFRKLAAEDFV